MKPDKWYFDSLKQRGFMGGDIQTAVAAELSQLQLWNPAASGVLGIVDQIHLYIATAGAISFRSHNAALTADGGNTETNKYLGGAAPSCMIKKGTGAAASGTGFTRMQILVDHTCIPFERPIVIPEGMGLIIAAVTVNINLEVSFEWIEVPI